MQVFLDNLSSSLTSIFALFHLELHVRFEAERFVRFFFVVLLIEAGRGAKKYWVMALQSSYTTIFFMVKDASRNTE